MSTGLNADGRLEVFARGSDHRIGTIGRKHRGRAHGMGSRHSAPWTSLPVAPAF